MSMSLVRLQPTHPKQGALLQEGPHLAKARRQAAVVRALIDHVERHVPGVPAEHPLRTQLREELARLGAQLHGAANQVEWSWK